MPAGDASALVEAVRQVAGDEALRSRLRTGARDLAGFFGWERIADLHARLYEELTCGRDV